MPVIACQRETGTAHALNALYEADRVVHTAGEPEIVLTPSASAKGKKIARCPPCRVAVWSNYAQAGPTQTLLCGDLFTRVGNRPAITDSDVVEPSIVTEDLFHYTNLGPSTGLTIRKLADLRP